MHLAAPSLDYELWTSHHNPQRAEASTEYGNMECSKFSNGQRREVFDVNKYHLIFCKV